MAALSYDENPNVMIVGVGLMGQYLTNDVGAWLGAAKLVLVDGADTINVGGERTALSDFAQSIRRQSVPRGRCRDRRCHQ